MDIQKTSRHLMIRNLYLYLVAAITLFMMAFSAVDLINIALKTWVFTKADQVNIYYPKQAPDAYCTFDKNNVRVCPSTEETAQRQADEIKQQELQRVAQKQSDIVRNISMLLVAIPLFIYHWSLIRRDKKEA